jgi:cysteine synthase
MTVSAVHVDYFRDLETPRFCALSENVVAASFPIMKLMPARYMLDRAAAAGDLKPGGHIVETTSGTFGMAVALLAAARAYRLTLVTASSLLDAQYQHRPAVAGSRSHRPCGFGRRRHPAGPAGDDPAVDRGATGCVLDAPVRQ